VKTLLSLCDYTGNWSRPYSRAGYRVIVIDLKNGDDVRLMEHINVPIHGILAAPPCTAFTTSGAQYWKKKDRSGETLEGIAIVDACLRAVALYQPNFWALENPVGRLRRWLGPPTFTFNPCDFGDPYTKRTLL
jgi:site-specific DNA-cytosine methylase